MNNDWTEISINTTIIAGELLSEFLIEEGAKGIVLGEWQPDNLSEYTIVKAYMPFDYEKIDELELKIQEQLKSYSESGLNTGANEVLVNKVKEEDWANSWKKYFHVLHIGKNLVIKPLWEDYSPKENDLVINFDPGMAFGTGAHPSTQLCMEKLEELPEIFNKDINILDLGTGSGILSIVMHLLGYENITAIDNDGVAVRASEENFSFNNMKINLFKGEIKDCTENYDFIAGNLLAEIIESIADKIAEKLNPNGLFMGAGIIKHKEESVKKALEINGLKLIETRYQGDWVLVLYKK
ncbi:MAG: 50S ribosomal protein L11 methyltransferase [Candidatus Sericytochromatia bacterium]